MNKKRGYQRSKQPSNEEEKEPRGQKPAIGAVLIVILTGAVALIATLNGLWHEWWLKFFLLPLTLAAIGYWLHEVISVKFPNAAAFSVVVYSLMAGSVTILLYVKNPQREEPAFSVIGIATFASNGPHDPPFLMLVSEGIMYPISFATHVDFTNIRMASGRIDSYSIEVEEAPRKWTSVELVDMQHRKVFFAMPPKDAIELDFGTKDFNAIVRTNGIAMNETISGWILMNVTNGLKKPMRMRVKDATGNVYLAAFRRDSKSEAGMVLRDGIAMHPTNRIDLTGYRLLQVGAKF